MMIGRWSSHIFISGLFGILLLFFLLSFLALKQGRDQLLSLLTFTFAAAKSHVMNAFELTRATPSSRGLDRAPEQPPEPD